MQRMVTEEASGDAWPAILWRSYSLCICVLNPVLPLRDNLPAPPPFRKDGLLFRFSILTPTTEAIEASLATLSVDARKRAEKDSAKKEAKAAAAEARDAERKAEAMVYIKRVERNKRKYVTAVSGLEAHGHDLKYVISAPPTPILV